MNRFFTIMSLVGGLVCAAQPSVAQIYTQQGSKFFGSGAVGSAGQGNAAALSADGTTAIVAGQVDNHNVGAVWVFTRNGATWSQQGSKLVGTDAVGAGFQGRSVALSPDGNTAIVGGYYDNSKVGAAWVFTRSGGVWTQQGSKLVGTGAIGAALQGESVSLSADGNTAVVGGDSDNSGAGAVWVFTRSGATWTQQGIKLVGTGAVGAAGQGYSTALSGDGNTAIIGGSLDNGSAGAAWVFTRSGGVWTQQGPKLFGTGGAANVAHQGISTALSADGNTAIFAGYRDNGDVGATWVFTRSAGVWTQQGDKLVGGGTVGISDQGVSSIALSADGNTAIVGGYADNGFAGAAWVFTRIGGVWTQQGNKLVGTGAVETAFQGSAVALSADGNMALVGGTSDNIGVGAVWIFARPHAPLLSTTFDGSSPTMSGRLARDVTSSTCAALKSYPGDFGIGTNYQYQTISYTHTGPTACVKFSMSGGTCGDNSVVSFYNGTFDPNNRATNYLTDAGEVGITRPAAVVLTKGQTVTVVITGADPSLDCSIAADADDPSLVFPGNLDATSLTMSGRVTRDGVGSTCNAIKAYPGDITGSGLPYTTGSYTHLGPSGCVQFTVTGGVVHRL